MGILRLVICALVFGCCAYGFYWDWKYIPLPEGYRFWTAKLRFLTNINLVCTRRLEAALLFHSHSLNIFICRHSNCFTMACACCELWLTRLWRRMILGCTDAIRHCRPTTHTRNCIHWSIRSTRRFHSQSAWYVQNSTHDAGHLHFFASTTDPKERLKTSFDTEFRNEW